MDIAQIAIFPPSPCLKGHFVTLNFYSRYEQIRQITVSTVSKPNFNCSDRIETVRKIYILYQPLKNFPGAEKLSVGGSNAYCGFAFESVFADQIEEGDKLVSWKRSSRWSWSGKVSGLLSQWKECSLLMVFLLPATPSSLTFYHTWLY